MAWQAYRFQLDQADRERLQIDLQSIAFCGREPYLARSRTIAGFERQLQQLRYGGQTTDYCHRQHYFTRTSALARAIEDLTPDLPGATTPATAQFHESSPRQQTNATARQRDCTQRWSAI